jgi:hypothetical protein
VTNVEVEPTKEEEEREEGSQLACGTHLHVGCTATSSKTTIKISEGLKIDGLDK